MTGPATCPAARWYSHPYVPGLDSGEWRLCTRPAGHVGDHRSELGVTWPDTTTEGNRT